MHPHCHSFVWCWMSVRSLSASKGFTPTCRFGKLCTHGTASLSACAGLLWSPSSCHDSADHNWYRKADCAGLPTCHTPCSVSPLQKEEHIGTLHSPDHPIISRTIKVSRIQRGWVSLSMLKSVDSASSEAEINHVLILKSCLILYTESKQSNSSTCFCSQNQSKPHTKSSKSHLSTFYWDRQHHHQTTSTYPSVQPGLGVPDTGASSSSWTGRSHWLLHRGNDSGAGTPLRGTEL